mgnify:CR=1 FL=1
MKNLFFTILGLFSAFAVSAQLVNDGGTIVVENGATLFIESNLSNNTVGPDVGSILVQGTGIIEVQGDVTNAGTFTMSNTSKLVFSGTNAANVTSGGATFTNVEMDKTTEDVTLLDNMTISNDLNFIGDDNKLVLGSNDLNLGVNATITSADDNEYVQADGTGVVSKEMDANAIFTYEIGDASNYSPLQADVTGSAYTGAALDVNVVAMVHPDVPAEATDFINRYWNVNQTGISDFDATLTGTYVSADLETGSDAMLVKGAFYNGMDWSYEGTSNGANTVIGSISENGDFTGTNSFGKIALTVFLEGAYSGGTMTTTLNSSNLIPLTSPYADGATVASIPADVVDWIEVEVRDQGNASSILSANSAFLRNDGVILDLSGNPIVSLINAPSNGYIGINHRNHLSINSASALSLMGGVTHDFSTGLGQAYDDPAIVNNDAMIDLGSGVYGLFRGDVNTNNGINFIDAAIARNGSSPIQSNVYSELDVNMNGGVNFIDAAITKSAATPIKSAHVQ